MAGYNSQDIKQVRYAKGIISLGRSILIYTTVQKINVTITPEIYNPDDIIIFNNQ